MIRTKFLTQVLVQTKIKKTLPFQHASQNHLKTLQNNQLK